MSLKRKLSCIVNQSLRCGVFDTKFATEEAGKADKIEAKRLVRKTSVGQRWSHSRLHNLLLERSDDTTDHQVLQPLYGWHLIKKRQKCCQVTRESSDKREKLIPHRPRLLLLIWSQSYRLWIEMCEWLL